MNKILVYCILGFAFLMPACRTRNSSKVIREKKYDSLYNEINDLRKRLRQIETDRNRNYEDTYSLPVDLKSEDVVSDTGNLKPSGKRLKNIYWENKSYLGIWRIENTRDDYGDPVGSPYVTTELTGELLCSNSAIPSLLKVKFFFFSDRILMKMYEYSGIIPLSGRGNMCLRIKNRNNEEFIIPVYNTVNGEVVVKDSSEFLKVMLSGGRLMFIVYTPGNGIANRYKFTIENADFLDRAIAKMNAE